MGQLPPHYSRQTVSTTNMLYTCFELVLFITSLQGGILEGGSYSFLSLLTNPPCTLVRRPHPPWYDKVCEVEAFLQSMNIEYENLCRSSRCQRDTRQHGRHRLGRHYLQKSTMHHQELLVFRRMHQLTVKPLDMDYLDTLLQKSSLEIGHPSLPYTVTTCHSKGLLPHSDI